MSQTAPGTKFVKRMNRQYGDTCASLQPLCEKSDVKFLLDRLHIANRPDANSEVEQMVGENCWLTIYEAAVELKISHNPVHHVIPDLRKSLHYVGTKRTLKERCEHFYECFYNVLKLKETKPGTNRAGKSDGILPRRKQRNSVTTPLTEKLMFTLF